MSIEALLKDLTEAIRENTEALQSGGGESAPKAESKPKASSGSKGKATKKGPTVDDIAEQAGNYLGAGSAADKKAAVANMKKLNAKYDVKRITEVEADQYEDVLADIAALAEGEDIFEDDGDGEESLV